MTDSNPQIPSLPHDSGDKRGNDESEAINPTTLYRHYDEAGVLLYVGISVSVLMRVSQHKLNSSWFNQVVAIKIERFPDYQSAATAEILAIKAEHPKYNVGYANSRPVRVVSQDTINKSRRSRAKNARLRKEKYAQMEIYAKVGREEAEIKREELELLESLNGRQID